MVVHPDECVVNVRIRYLSGEEVSLDDTFNTIQEVKYHLAKMHDMFTPEICLLNASGTAGSTGTNALTKLCNTSEIPPTHMVAILQRIEDDETLWKQALKEHALNKDAAGVRRAVEIMGSKKGMNTANIIGLALREMIQDGSGELEVDTLRLLLTAGEVNVNVANDDGWTALHFAVEGSCLNKDHVEDYVKNMVEIIEVLLDANANVDAADLEGWTPLHIASLHGQTETAKMIIDAGANLNVETALSLTPLHLACIQGNSDVVEALIQEPRLDVNIGHDNICTALHKAVDGGHEDCVRLLLSRSDLEVNHVDFSGWTALLTASFQYAGPSSSRIIEMLVEAGADVNIPHSNGNTVLFDVLEWDNAFDLVKLLIEKGNAEVNYADNYGWTALHIACENGATDIVSLLIEHGVDIDQCISSGCNAFMIATIRGKTDVVELLVNAGMNVNIGDRQGWTALQEATVQEDVGMVQILLSAGADVNVRDQNGWTPLHDAVSKSSVNYEIVKLLLEAKANINLRATDQSDQSKETSWTPLEIAIKKEHDNIVSLLYLYGRRNAIVYID